MANSFVLTGPGEIPGIEATVFEYFWDGEQVGWVPWVQLVPEYIHRPELPFNKILVPTVDTVRITWILDILVKRQCPVFMFGLRIGVRSTFSRGAEPSLPKKIFQQRPKNCLHNCFCPTHPAQ